MRFLSAGPDIPLELVTAQEKGQTLFAVLAYRAAFPLNPFSVYFWSGSTAVGDRRFANWHDVVGVDWSMSIAAVPPAGSPAARAQIGIGESLDAPFRRRVRAYVSLILNP